MVRFECARPDISARNTTARQCQVQDRTIAGRLANRLIQTRVVPAVHKRHRSLQLPRQNRWCALRPVNLGKVNITDEQQRVIKLTDPSREVQDSLQLVYDTP